ncbi:MAG TPA: hypothetical protein VFU21_02530 [Kofleriaceae bacterium]|nr:hypothetical protein [Kofleriaceae bacterium]
MRIRTAVQDVRLAARIVERRPLLYAGGASAALDRPAHVRAASGLAWVGTELAVVQDDAAFLALCDPASGRVRGVPLPRGPGGHRQFDDARGNKADKLDLEAVFVAGGLLVGLGSGATPARRRALVCDAGGAGARIADAGELYLAMEAVGELAGSELNLEGAAALADGRLRLFQRGNGDPARARPPVDATLDLALGELLAYLAGAGPAPRVDAALVTQYRLGEQAGVRLTFTDAAMGDRLHYLACAERSPDAVRDGEVVGSAIGVFDEVDGDRPLRFAPLTGGDGEPVAVKAEGLAFGPDGVAWVVLDADDPARPSDLCRVELAGPWSAPAT